MEHSIPRGLVVGERWRVIGSLGAGGFGQVLLAEDVSELGLGQAAVKVLHPNTSVRERQDFLDEVKQMATLRHQNLVGYLDSGLLDTDDGEIRPFLVTELCHGSLQDRLDAADGAVAPTEVAQILGDVAAGLAHLHQRGLIHRDIKPGNVLYADGYWKLADFGLMRNLSATGSYHRGDLLMGTPLYMAPELFSTMAATTPSDVYAFGVLAHLVASGRPVHQGVGQALVHNITSTPPSIDPTVDPGLYGLIERCLDAAPDRRPNAEQLEAWMRAWTAAPSDRQVTSLVTPPVSAGFEPSPIGMTTTADPSAVTTPPASGGQPGGSPSPLTSDGTTSGGRWLLLAAVGAVVMVGLIGLAFLLGGDGDDDTALGSNPAGSDETALDESSADDQSPTAQASDGGVQIGDGVEIGDGSDDSGEAAIIDASNHFATAPCSAESDTMVELTNGHHQAVDYEIMLDHLDAEGTRVGETFEVVRALEPGQTALVDLTWPDEEEAKECRVDTIVATTTPEAELAGRDQAEVVSCVLDDFLTHWYEITYTVTNPTNAEVYANTSFAVVDADGVRLDESFTDMISDIGPGERVRGETSEVFWALERTDREAVDCVITAVEFWN